MVTVKSEIAATKEAMAGANSLSWTTILRPYMMRTVDVQGSIGTVDYTLHVIYVTSI